MDYLSIRVMVNPMRPAPLFFTALALVACSDDSEKSDQGSVSGAKTVMLFTIDTVRSRILHSEEKGWDTSPNMHAFFEGSVHFTRAASPPWRSLP